MLRSAGFEILQHPEDEVYICRAKSETAETDLSRATNQAKESLGSAIG